MKKDGAVVLVWNREDRFASVDSFRICSSYTVCSEAAGWVAQLFDRIEAHRSDTPDLYINRLRQEFSTPEYASLFHPHEERICPYNPLVTDQLVTDRALSWSYISVLPSDEKAKFVEDVKGILERGDSKAWINKEEGTYEYPYKTLVVASRKKSGSRDFLSC